MKHEWAINETWMKHEWHMNENWMNTEWKMNETKLKINENERWLHPVCSSQLTASLLPTQAKQGRVA